MPNPSNSDLVGEAKRLSEFAAETDAGVGRFLQGEISQRKGEFVACARTLLPELAQQLEQAREALAVAQRDFEQVHASGSSPGDLVLIDNALWRVRAALTPESPPVEADLEEEDDGTN